jgi:RNA-binding protein 5/10
VISQAPVAVSFAASTSFVPAPAGPLGGQYLVRASRKGGIGSDSIHQPDGDWCAYWHEQGGAVETIPKSAAPEGAIGPELSTELKVFLGGLAGPLGPQATSVGVPTGTSAPSQGLLSGIGMQPIKIGAPAGKGKKKEREEDMLVPLGGKNVLGGEEEEEIDAVGKDTVLRSRSESRDGSGRR